MLPAAAESRRLSQVGQKRQGFEAIQKPLVWPLHLVHRLPMVHLKKELQHQSKP